MNGMTIRQGQQNLPHMDERRRTHKVFSGEVGFVSMGICALVCAGIGKGSPCACAQQHGREMLLPNICIRALDPAEEMIFVLLPLQLRGNRSGRERSNGTREREANEHLLVWDVTLPKTFATISPGGGGDQRCSGTKEWDGGGNVAHARVRVSEQP